jgi:biofilm PGA synthesis lipoprotein PgaB
VERKKKVLIVLLSLLAFFNAAALFKTVEKVTAQSDRIHYKDKVIVLLYHHIDDKEDGVTISQEKFQSHIRALKKENYRFISMDELLAFMKENKPLPPNAIHITFDDGYESFYTKAYPILQEERVSATNFIVVYSSDDPEARPLLPHLTWEQMKEMKQNGQSFYSHTYDHHHYLPGKKDAPVMHALAHPMYLEEQKRLENPKEYKKRVKNDIALANVIINEKLGAQPRLLAFPYGDYNETVLQAAKEAGVQLFFSARDGINDRNTPILFRINAGAYDISAKELIYKLKKYDE